MGTWRHTAAGLLFAGAVFGVGWDLMAPTARAAAAAAPAAPAAGDAAHDTHEAGRRIYNFRCYYCHGYSGDAKTLAATYLQPAPAVFAGADAAQWPRDRIERAVREGRPGTAMAAFANVLDTREIAAVAAFVEREFVRERAPNTRYHTAANGWPDHDRHEAAFPFARGEIALDAPEDTLAAAQRAGRRLFLATCVSCHDRARVADEGPAWSSRPVSYPRMGFVPGQPNTPPVDAVSSASVYAKHEVPPPLDGLDARERRGAALFQANCAFCHGGDGTGKNWIGQFMEPKARDLTAYTRATMPAPRLRQVILEGLPGTSMPAWQHVLSADEVDALAAFVQRALFRDDTALAGATR
jgi:cytochrome c oxidase cbb3-type subunit III